MKRHYRNSLLTQRDIKWKPKTTTTEDGGVDLTIRVPLSKMLDVQAKRACALGVVATLTFMAECIERDKPIDAVALSLFVDELGIPELKTRLTHKEKSE